MVVAFFLVVPTLILINGMIESNELKNSYELTTGVITYFGYSAGSAGSGADYIFEVERVRYEGGFPRTKFCVNPNKVNDPRLKSIKIPIVYELGNPENSKMLLKKEDYKEFKVEYPEELSDFLSKYFECERHWYD